MSWFYKFYCRDKKKSAKNFSFWEMHHAFTGAIITVISLYPIFQHKYLLGWFGVFMGIWLILDDFYQHHVQGKQIEENELKYGERFYTCHTFLNWFPYWVLRKLGLYK